MFENIIKELLGDWGSVLLNFILSHQLIISIAVVAWGIIMIVINRRKKKRAADLQENNE